jgi:hypothetical protein
MKVSTELPEQVAAALSAHTGASLPRKLLEMAALEGYRSGKLSNAQVMRMLGFDHRLEVHAFRKERGVALDYAEAELDDDLRTLRELGRL